MKYSMKPVTWHGRKKLRGQRRHFEWLRSWTRTFFLLYPPRDMHKHAYWNWKIPISFDLVAGRRGRIRNAIHCAQLLLDATAGLIAARPEWAKDCRVTCNIQTPDMFGSEVCLYIDEDYFQEHISPEHGEYRIKERLPGKSLARRWNLSVPEGFQELGVSVFDPDPEDGDYRNEWWFFGELD
jgi:hypothetical protein